METFLEIVRIFFGLYFLSAGIHVGMQPPKEKESENRSLFSFYVAAGASLLFFRYLT